MRITGLTTTTVAVPFRHEERWAFGTRRGATAVLLELATDAGIVGLAEAAGYPTPEVVQSVFRALEPLVVGEDPRRIERLISLIDTVGTWHHVRATSPAIAAVETACWDVVGKACGLPVVDLLGGRVRDRAPYVWYLARTDPAETAQRAVEGVERGFSTLYVKVGWGTAEDDLALLRAVRDAVGPDVGIRVDANEAWSSGEAVRTIGRLEEVGLELVEQPVSARNLPEMAELRRRIATPVLANEATWTRHDVLDVVRHGAADAVSLDQQMDGGLLNMKRAAGICDAAGLPAVKHSLGELGLATAAALHVICSTTTFGPAHQCYASLLADDVVVGDVLATDDGCLAVPDGPGLGVELDRDAVARAAERYRREGAAFAFHDPDALAETPRIPRR